MAPRLNLTQSDIFTALRYFLLAVLPGAGSCVFTGSIAGTVLTVTGLTQPAGALAVGDPVIGPGVAPGTVIQSLGTGTGGLGTYNIFPSQTVAPARILSNGVPVFQGQTNRVVESPCADFCVMWPVTRDDVETNVSLLSDTKTRGSISGQTMTIDTFYFGAPIGVGSPVFGVGVVPGSRVIGLGTGTGQDGTYLVAPSQNVSQRVLAMGALRIKQPTNVGVQIDIHGPNASDNVQVITTLFEDEYGTTLMRSLGFDVSPLETSNPRQVPFQNAQQQWETRWVITAQIQANQIVIAPLEYADVLDVNLIEVEATYAP